MSTITLFGKRVKELRKKKNITQEKLAEILSLDNQTISRIESGYFFTSYDNLEKMAIALEVEIKDFFDFGHLQQKSDLKKYIQDRIANIETKELQKIAKFIKEFI